MHKILFEFETNDDGSIEFKIIDDSMDSLLSRVFVFKVSENIITNFLIHNSDNISDIEREKLIITKESLHNIANELVSYNHSSELISNTIEDSIEHTNEISNTVLTLDELFLFKKGDIIYDDEVVDYGIVFYCIEKKSKYVFTEIGWKLLNVKNNE